MVDVIRKMNGRRAQLTWKYFRNYILCWFRDESSHTPMAIHSEPLAKRFCDFVFFHGLYHGKPLVVGVYIYICIYIYVYAIPQGSINQIFVGYYIRYIPYSQGIYVASFWCFQSTRLAGSLLQITEMIRNVTHLLHALWLFLVESVGNAFACLAWIVKRSLCVFAHKQAEMGGLTDRIGFVSFHGVCQKKSVFVRLGQGEGNSFVAGFNMWLCVYL